MEEMQPQSPQKEGTPAGQGACLRQAVKLTVDTFNRRSWWYRNLVIVFVCGFVLACAVLVFVSWQAWPAVLFLLPLCGFFFLLDGHLVRRWQMDVMAFWVEQALDLSVFLQTVSAMRQFPQRTLKGLLALLPREGGNRSGNPISPVARKAVAITGRTIQQCQLDRLTGLVLAATIVVSGLLLRPVCGSGAALLGVATGVVAAAAGFATVVFRLRQLQRLVSALDGDPEFGLDGYIDSARRLDWRGIAEGRQAAFFRGLAPDFSQPPGQSGQTA